MYLDLLDTMSNAKINVSPSKNEQNEVNERVDRNE